MAAAPVLNSPPTAANGTVTTNEDTEHTFAATDFSYLDGDSDALVSVKITGLPASGKGELTLDGTVIGSGALTQTVTANDLSTSKLKYKPPSNANGNGFASFKFRVNDGTVDSTAEYTITINVTQVNDSATGAPTISGIAQVGQTLTASTAGIADVDGLPTAFTYQWKRYAANGTTFEANIGSNSSTYAPTNSEEGKKVKVEVSFTDDDGNDEGPLVSAAHPSSGTVLQLSVSFLQGAYTVAEGGTQLVTVRLSADPERAVVIPISHTPQNGAESPADYSGVPANLTFNSGDTERTFTFTATDDADDDDDESVRIGFGGLPIGVSTGATDQTTISITDNDHPLVTVSFSQATYTVEESGTQTVTVTVRLSADPERTVVIPITAMPQGTTAPADYSRSTNSLTFNTGNEEQTFTFTATNDLIDDDGESVLLGFGTLPPRVTAGATATVSIDDDDGAGVTVSKSGLTIDEGSSGTYTIKLDSQPTADVTVTINDPTDNTDVKAEPASLTFTSSNWASPQTVTASAAQDEDAVNETGTVTHSVSSSDTTYSSASAVDVVVTVTDDDDPRVTVSFERGEYTVPEGVTQAVTVTLSAVPERMVDIPITHMPKDGAIPDDYSGVPTNLIFSETETSKTITFEATQDDEDDDDESVLLGFGTVLPLRVSAGATTEATVSITDDDVPAVTVSFDQETFTVAEGNSVTVTVTLSADPERTVDIPITVTPQNPATTDDYSVSPTSVRFIAGDRSKEITFAATQDNEDDDDETVQLAIGAPPPRVTAGATTEATVSITDDDDPQVTVLFSPATYTVTEGNTQSVTVKLSADPERTVIIPITHTPQNGAESPADYSGVPTNVTFNTGNVEQTFTFTATDDMIDDDGESVLLGFDTLPPRVSAGATATVNIDDDDGVGVTVSVAGLTIDEGSSGTYTIKLDSQPTANVTVTINDPTVNTDVTAEPASLIFSSSNWSTAQTVTVNVAQDVDALDGTATVTHTVTSTDNSYNGASANNVVVTVTDDDDPRVTVSFSQAAYSVDEGANMSVTVMLSADPERTVEIPITATNQGGATAADYTDLPTSLTFAAGVMSQTITFAATDDKLDDDNESVLLGFGTGLPLRVTVGGMTEATVSIIDDDDAGVEVSDTPR